LENDVDNSMHNLVDWKKSLLQSKSFCKRFGFKQVASWLETKFNWSAEEEPDVVFPEIYISSDMTPQQVRDLIHRP
jgi:hypothetical protein